MEDFAGAEFYCPHVHVLVLCTASGACQKTRRCTCWHQL